MQSGTHFWVISQLNQAPTLVQCNRVKQLVRKALREPFAASKHLARVLPGHMLDLDFVRAMPICPLPGSLSRNQHAIPPHLSLDGTAVSRMSGRF